MRALAEAGPEVAVGIEHEDASHPQTEGPASAAKNLHGAAAAF
ncbi:hypothetical protein [Streptomyces acidiscabies]